jgi:hypothetical protein
MMFGRFLLLEIALLLSILALGVTFIVDADDAAAMVGEIERDRNDDVVEVVAILEEEWCTLKP